MELTDVSIDASVALGNRKTKTNKVVFSTEDQEKGYNTRDNRERA